MAAISLPHPSGPRARPRSLTPRPAPHRPPSAVVRRRQAAMALVVLAALGTLLGAGSLAGAGQAPAEVSHVRPVPVVATTHVVQPGDTLWTLARRLQPDGDVRPLVSRLRTAHGGGPLVPGQRLLLAV